MSTRPSSQPDPEPFDRAADPEALPAELARELTALATSDIPVPPAIDQRILQAATAHLTRRRWNAQRIAPWAAVAAAAAVLLLLFLPLWLQTGTSPSGGEGTRQRLAAAPRGGVEPASGDLHPVDILPAFALERELDRGGHPSARWDINGDGIVDQRDVDALARQVTLISAPAPAPGSAPGSRAASPRAADDDGLPGVWPDAPPQGRRFAAISVYIDPQGKTLAAYQIHFSARRGHIKIVGIENGDGPAFGDRPPYFDHKAVEGGQSDRVIVACFNAKPGAELPTGGTRVTTIHVMIEGATEPEYQARLDAAADGEGHRIDAAVSLSQGAQP